MFRGFPSRALALAAAVGSVSASGTNRFGFTGPEVFPIDPGIALLHAADLDGDGLNDLIVVNNARSKINILYNRTGKTNALAEAVLPKNALRDVNELPPDARFRIDSIASEKRIFALVTGDFNGDGRTDLAYYGDPKELVMVANLGANGWAAPRRWSIEDGLPDPGALITADVNGDGKPDLVLLGEKAVYAITSKADGTLGEPEKITYSGTVKGIQNIDLNGDGRDDLLFVNWESANPFRFRLNVGPMQFGPEIHLPLAAIRSYTAEDLDGDKVPEIVTIAARSGRAAVSHFAQQPAEALVAGLKDGQFSTLALPKTEKSRRGVRWADLDGDGLPDLVYANPEDGELTLQFQTASGDLAAPKSFPTLTGVSDIVAMDWDGDGRAELFVLSGDEKQIGMTTLSAAGRVEFPKPLPLQGKPLIMAGGSLHKGEAPRLAVVTEREEKKAGKDGKDETSTVRELVLVDKDLKTTTQRLSETFKGAPVAMEWHDANQDGLPDLVILSPYDKVKLLVQRSNPGTNGLFLEADVNPPGGGVDAPWMATADVDGDGKPELLLAQKNFIRAVVLAGDEKAGWTFSVKDQINGSSGSSRIVAATALAAPGGGAPTIFLLDADRKVLTACVRESSGVWKAAKNPTLPVTEFTQIAPLALGGKTPNAIGFVGVNNVAWKKLDGQVWQFTELDGYETPIKDGHLHDVVAGDLNGDGRKDLVFIETAHNYIDLVSYDPPHSLLPANRWPVFEERAFRARGTPVAEPREAIVADVTGDKKNDLILIVHDRVLLYPQE
jgi:FG-GAP-like repeat